MQPFCLSFILLTHTYIQLSTFRLNVNQTENHQTVPAPIVSAKKTTVTTTASDVSKKQILNTVADPTAEQNTTNNTAANMVNTIAVAAAAAAAASNNNNNIIIDLTTSTASKSTKLTDFFPVRRSVRKTKKAVEQEQMRNIEAAIRNAQQDGLTVKKFGDKGRGVVTARPFAKGEFVVEYMGELIDMQEADRREQLYAKDENTGCYMYYFKYRNQQYW